MKRKLAISISILAVILICLSACKPVADKPNLAYVTGDRSITITKVEGAVYSIDDGEFGANNVFTGLTPGNHKIAIKIAETSEKLESEKVEATVAVKGSLTNFAINSIPDKKYGDAAFQLSCNSGSNITYSVVSGQATTTTAGMVTITGVGRVVVKAVSPATDTAMEATAQAEFNVAKATQTGVTVNEVTGKKVGETFTLSLTGKLGGGAVTYALTSGDNVATVSAAGNVTAIGAGTFTVKAVVGADTLYEGFETAVRTITIGKAAGSLAISNIPTLQINTLTSIVVTGPGTGALTYAITGSDSDAAKVENGQIIFNRSATVTLTVTRAADANYEAASASISVTASTAFQFKAYEGDIRLNDDIVLETMGGNGKGAVTLSIKSGYTSVAEVLPNGRIRIKAPSTFIVVATKAAEGTHAVQTIEKEFIAKRALQAPISVLTAPDAKYNTPFDLNVTGGSVVGSAITYEILKDINVNNGKIDANGKIVPTSMSQFTVTVTKAGDAQYEDVTCTYTVTNIQRASVTLTISTTLVDPVFGSTHNLTGAGAVVSIDGASANDVTFSVVDVDGTGVASINPTTKVLTINKVGTFKIVASIPASVNYEGTSASTGEINSIPAEQTPLTYQIDKDDIALGDTFKITVGGGIGSGTLTLRDMTGSTTNFTITGDGNVFTLTAKTPGSFTMEIANSGDATYKPAVTWAPVVVTKERQAAINITAVGPFTFKASPNNVTFTVDAKQDLGSGLKALTGTVTYTISENASIAHVDNAGKVTVYGAGTFKVKVTKAGYTTAAPNPVHDYRDESAEITVIVHKANQEELKITNIPASLYYGDSFTPSYTGGSTNKPVIFTIPSSSVAAVGAGNQVKINGVGGFTLMATMAGDDNYADAVAIMSLVGLHANNDTVDFDGASAFQYKDANHQIVLKNNKSAGRVTFNVKGTSVSAGSLNMTSTGILQFNGVGTITVEAVIAADANYAVKTITRTYTVNKADQSGFAFTTYPQEAEYETTIDVVATGGNTTGDVTYASDNPANGNHVGLNDKEGKFKILIGDGASLSITAKRAGNDFYNDAYANVQITLTNKSQSTPLVQIYNVTTGGLLDDPTAGSNAIRYGDTVGVRVYGFDFMTNGSGFSVKQDGSQDKLTLVAGSQGTPPAPDPAGGYTVKMSARFTTKGVGKASIVITLAGDLRFKSLTITQEITIVANDSDFVLDEDDFTKTYGQTLDLDEILTAAQENEVVNGALNVVFELKNTADRQFVSINGSKLLFVGAKDDVVIVAKRIANGFYTADSAEFTVDIDKAQQVVKTTPNATSAIKVEDIFTFSIASADGYSVPMWSGKAPTASTIVSGTPATIAYNGTGYKDAFKALAIGTSVITFTIPGNDNLEDLNFTVTLTVGMADQAALKIYQDKGKDPVAGTLANPVKVKYGSTIVFSKDDLGAGFTSVYASGGSGTGTISYAAKRVQKDGKDDTAYLALNRLGWMDTVNTYTVFAAKSSALGIFQITATKAADTNYNKIDLVFYVEIVTGDAPKLTAPTQAITAGYGSTLDKAFYEAKTLFVSNDVIGHGAVVTNVISDPEYIISGNKIVSVSSQNVYAKVTITKSGTYKHPTAPKDEAAFKFYEDATSGEFSIRAIKGTPTLAGEFEELDNYYVGNTYRVTVTSAGSTGTISLTGAADTYKITKVAGSANQFDVQVLKIAAADAKPLTINQAYDAFYNATSASINNPEFELNSYIDFMELTLVGSDGSEATYTPSSFDPSVVLTLKFGITYTYTIVGAHEFSTHAISGTAGFQNDNKSIWLDTTDLANVAAGMTGSFDIAQVANSIFGAGNTYTFNYVCALGPQAPIYLARSDVNAFAIGNSTVARLVLTTDPEADKSKNPFTAAIAAPITTANIGSMRNGTDYDVKISDPDKILKTENGYSKVVFGSQNYLSITFPNKFTKPGSFTITITMLGDGNFFEDLVYEYVVVVSKAVQGDFDTNLLYDTYVTQESFVYGSNVDFKIESLLDQADPKTTNALTFTIAEEYQHILSLNAANGTFRVIGAGLVDKNNNPLPAIIKVTRPGDATYADKVYDLEIFTHMGKQTLSFLNSDATQTLVFKEYYTPAELLNLSFARGDILMSVSNVSKANIAYPNNTGAGNNLFLYGIGEFDVSFQAAEVKNPTTGYYSASNLITKRFKIVAAEQPAMTINNALIGNSINTQYTLQVIQASTMANAPVIWTVEYKKGDGTFVAATAAQATVSSSTVTILEAGTYRITASKEGKILANPKYDVTEIYYNTATVNGEFTFA